MTAPRWNNRAFEVSVVLSGGGRVEIVRPDSAEERSREERERGSESQREREVESYRRVEDELNVGDVFLVPAGYPSVQIANSEEQFEILTFLINDEHNDINFLTGNEYCLAPTEIFVHIIGDQE